MIFSVNLYKKTGFSVLNAPDSVENVIKNGVDKKLKVDDIYRLQPYILDEITVNSKFQEIESVDYCILSNVNFENIGYFVHSKIMINENTCQLILIFDAVGTFGVGYNPKYSIIGGWLTRRHYSKSEDTLFNNILPEEFTPALPTKNVFFNVDFGAERTHLIASSVNLTDNNGRLSLGIDFLDYGGSIITRPIIKGAKKTTQVTLPENNTTGGLPQNVNALAIYDADDLEEDIFNKLNAYNLINVITASYQVPSSLLKVSSKADGGFYQSISGSGLGITTDIVFKYSSDVKNNKVFALGSTITIMSISSGNFETFQPFEVFTEGYDNFRINVMADLTPAGRPYCRPEYYRGYKGNGMTSYYKCVAGTSWNNSPLITDGANGYAFNQILEKYNTSISNAKQGSLSANFQAQKSSINTSTQQSMNNSNLQLSINNTNYDAMNKYGQDYYNLIDQQANPNIASWANSWIDRIAGGGGNNYRSSNFIYQNSLNSLQNSINSVNLLRENNNILNNMQLLIADKQQQLNALSTTFANNSAIISLERAKELTQFNVQNMVTPPTFNFPSSSGLQNFLGNGFVVIQEQLNPVDVKRFDNYLTLFGYSVCEEIDEQHFKNRPYYNFIQCSFLKIKNISGSLPQYLINALEEQLKAGVRIWHTFPNDVTEEQLYSNGG